MIPKRKPSDSSWTLADYNTSEADDLEIHSAALDSGRTNSSSSRHNVPFQVSSEEHDTLHTISKSVSQGESKTQKQTLTTIEDQYTMEDDKLTLTTDFENETNNKVTKCRSETTQETPVTDMRFCINQSSPKFFCAKTMIGTSESNRNQSNQQTFILNKSSSRSQGTDYTPAVDKTVIKEYFESIPQRKVTQNDLDSDLMTRNIQDHMKISQTSDGMDETKQGIEVTCPLFLFQSTKSTTEKGQEEIQSLPSQSHKGNTRENIFENRDPDTINENNSDELETQVDLENHKRQNDGILRNLCMSMSSTDLDSVFCKVGKLHFSKRTFGIAMILSLAIMISIGFVLGVAIIGPNENQQNTHQVTTDQITRNEDIYQTAPPFFFVWNTQAPSQHPTKRPSISYSPSNQPTNMPSKIPTKEPSLSHLPSQVPTLSVQPTNIPSSIPSSTPSISPRTLEITNLILSMDYMTNDKLYDQSSPQHKAFEWIIYNDPMQIHSNSPRLLQRYHLVALYHTNGGRSWQNNESWLSGDDECKWYGVKCNDSHEVKELRLGK